ncbi:hypothetical protein [Caballeronia sp. ATUFL_M2_KS44]|nr:hypothetical protein [Caballeronia sp. ATUFL_M2_KS44]
MNRSTRLTVTFDASLASQRLIPACNISRFAGGGESTRAVS